MRTQTIPQQTVQEDIISFEHQVGKFVKVLVGKGSNNSGVFTPFQNQTYEVFTIDNKPGSVQSITNIVLSEDKLYYQELMSANPIWAPNKPANTFRKEDLWHFVDLIRAQ